MRHQCLRWLDHENGTVHAWSLNPYAIDHEDRCNLFIPLISSQNHQND